MHPDRLLRRARALEQRRRPIRIAVAVVVGAVGFVVLPDLLGSDWPRFHARLTALAGAIALAFVVDIALAALVTMWEVKHDRLARERLPRAVLRK